MDISELLNDNVYAKFSFPYDKITIKNSVLVYSIKQIKMVLSNSKTQTIYLARPALYAKTVLTKYIIV